MSVFYRQALRGIPLGWRLGRDCGYIEIGLFPYFLDVNRKRNFFELVDELVDRTSSSGFRSLRCSWIDQVTIKAARSVCNENPGADEEGGGPWGAQSCRWKMPSNSSIDRWRNPLPSALAVGVLPPNSLRDTPKKIDCRHELAEIRARWSKEHKDLDRFGPPERNTLRPVWRIVLP